MYYKKRLKPQNKRQVLEEFLETDESRLIEMAWQDRTTFDCIYLQYGLTENQLKNKMRKLLNKKSFNRWRKRVQERKTKHKSKVYEKITRFQGPW